MYSPADMEIAPAIIPAIAVNKMSLLDRLAPVTPATSKKVDTNPGNHINQEKIETLVRFFANSVLGVRSVSRTIIDTQDNVAPVLKGIAKVFALEAITTIVAHFFIRIAGTRDGTG